jgi:hypothetical protein
MGDQQKDEKELKDEELDKVSGGHAEAQNIGRGGGPERLTHPVHGPPETFTERQ